MTEPLPPRVQRFLAAHIDSIEKLEVLLLLRARAERSWTAAAVAQELRIMAPSAQTRLDDLTRRGLLVHEPDGGFRFNPQDSEDAYAVAELARTYATHRVSVITFIFSAPRDSLRDFSDAFRLGGGKKGKE